MPELDYSFYFLTVMISKGARPEWAAQEQPTTSSQFIQRPDGAAQPQPMTSSWGSSIITYIIVAGQLNHYPRHRRCSFSALTGRLNHNPIHRCGAAQSLPTTSSQFIRRPDGAAQPQLMTTSWGSSINAHDNVVGLKQI